MARARVQHRHGTFSNYENNKTTILNDEIVVVDSGHPDTPDGSALYYRPSGASEPVRVANAGELAEAGINVETVTESQLSNATGDNIYLCLINSRWHKVICVSGTSTRAQYAVSAYHNFIYRWQSKSGDSWGQWTDWSPIGIADNIRDGAITLSKLGTDVLEQLDNKGVRIITPEESAGWSDWIPLTFAGELYDIAGWNDKLWMLNQIVPLPGGGFNYFWEPLVVGTDLDLKENVSNKVNTISSESTSSQYPSVLAVKNYVDSVVVPTQDISGNLPIIFEKHVGLVDARDLSLYGTTSLGNYHTSIPVQEGEKYIISCRSSSAVYPGAFYTLNGVKVSAIFEDSATHLNAEIIVPSGVDTLWINSKSTIIPLDDWELYRVTAAPSYCEDNEQRISNLEGERRDEQLETLRRLKNLEVRDTFRWKPFDKAYYCFVNDGTKNYTHVYYDVFHAHSMPLVSAAVGKNIELTNDTQTSGGRTVKQTLDAIVADGGEVMVYLNAAELKSTDPFELWYEYAVKNGKRMIESYGYNARGLILSAQSAQNSEVGQQICERFFDYADHVGTHQQYDIRRTQFSDTSSVADVKAYIDRTINTPGFYPIMFHRPSQEPWATAEGMDEILTYIESLGSSAAVTTYSHVFDTFGTNGYLTLDDLPIYNGGVQ